MTIYIGDVSHKPSADHLAGKLRHVEGATDNDLLAQAFGVKGHANAISSNGKIPLIDLFPNGEEGIIYADPNELTRIDDIDFIQNHLSIIVNWGVIVKYMNMFHRGELRLALTDINISENLDTLTNKAQIAVTKYFFGEYSQEEAQEILDKQNSNERFNDEIGRNVLGKNKQFSFSLHGLIFNFNVKTTHFYLQNRQITVNFKIDYGNLMGSARQIKGKNAKAQICQFKFFKRKVNELTRNKSLLNLKYTHHFNSQQLEIEIIDELNSKIQNDLEQIKKQVKNYLNNIQPEEVGIDNFDDYNMATAVGLLWRELRFPTSEISTSYINQQSISQWYHKEITTNEFLKINEHVLVIKLKNALIGRFNKNNIDFDAYINRALEYAQDDLRGVELTELVSVAHQVAKKAVEEYLSSLLQTNDLNELIEIYHTSNRKHDQQIIERISNKIITQIGQSAGEDDPKLKSKIENYVTKALPQLALERYQIFLQNNGILLNSDMDQNLVERYLEDNIDLIISRSLTKTKQMNTSLVDDYLADMIHNLIPSIDQYFKNHFDSIKALNKARQKIFNNLKTTIPYSKMDNGYWINKLNQITSFDTIKQFQYADNLDQFVNQFASDFADELQQKTSVTPAMVNDKFNEIKASIFEKIISIPLSKKIHEELQCDFENLPNEIQDQIDNFKTHLKRFVEKNFQTFIQEIKLFPSDNVANIIDRFENEESDIIRQEINNELNWQQIKNVLNNYREQEKQNVQAIKQRLIMMFNTYIHDETKGQAYIMNYFAQFLLTVNIKEPIFSINQANKIKFYKNKLLAEIQSSFDVKACQATDLHSILDGRISYEEYIQNYLRDLNIQNMISQLVNLNELTEIAFSEIAEDLMDDTNLNKTIISQYLKENFPGIKINSFNDTDYDITITKLSDMYNSPSDQNNLEDRKAIIDRLFTQANFIIVDEELPQDVLDLLRDADKYSDKYQLIDENYDEICENAQNDYFDFTKNDLNDVDFKDWILQQSLSTLANYAGYSHPTILTKAEVEDRYLH